MQYNFKNSTIEENFRKVRALSQFQEPEGRMQNVENTRAENKISKNLGVEILETKGKKIQSSIHMTK